MRRRWLDITGFLCAILLASAIPAAATPDGTSVPFQTIAAGRSAGVLRPAQVVIRDQEAWLALWRRHAGPGAAPPALDFGRVMVIAVFGRAGDPRTVAVTRIDRSARGLTVWFVNQERKPPLDGGGPARGASFHLVRLAQSSLPVTFQEAKVFPVVPQP
jgi:hypothetical protein